MPTPLETVTLRDAATDATAWLAPSRGAIVTRFEVAGRERLYLDESTLLDPGKNVRGGIPILFPSPGKLADGRFARGGRAGAMKQHGFARDLPWTVVEAAAASARLTLTSNAATRTVFPWDFSLSLRVSLRAARLRLDLTVTNDDAAPLPFGFGVHPYFAVADKASATITTAASRAFDNVRGQQIPFRGFALGDGETDLHLIDHGSTESTLTADGGSITVRGSAEFTRWVVWTLPERPFVCLEPWTAPGDALNSGDGLLTIASGAARDIWIEVDAVAS